ncbi:MAG: tRNA(fMet)-specific endonuclease VapC [Thiopseudomonas sp.]
MIKYLLDTNIVIYTMKNRPPAIREAFNRHYGQMCISSVTYMELVYGAERSSRPEANLRDLQGFVARMDVLPYEDAAAVHTGQIRAELAVRGTPIGPYDAMIAGHARSLGLIVVTNNLGEFVRVDGLRVENWL